MKREGEGLTRYSAIEAERRGYDEASRGGESRKHHPGKGLKNPSKQSIKGHENQAAKQQAASSKQQATSNKQAAPPHQEKKKAYIFLLQQSSRRIKYIHTPTCPQLDSLPLLVGE
jgi:hypothetical protein